jgi:hypothetical protein
LQVVDFLSRRSKKIPVLPAGGDRFIKTMFEIGGFQAFWKIYDEFLIFLLRFLIHKVTLTLGDALHNVFKNNFLLPSRIK